MGPYLVLPCSSAFAVAPALALCSLLLLFGLLPLLIFALAVAPALARVLPALPPAFAKALALAPARLNPLLLNGFQWRR